MLNLLFLNLLACGDTEEKIVSVSFDEACNPLAISDDCLLPYPSLHYTTADENSATGVRLAYQSEHLYAPDDFGTYSLDMVNIADGVSPMSPSLVNFSVDIDPSFLSGWGEQEQTVASGAPIALIDVDTGTSVPILTEMNQKGRDWEQFDDRHPLIIRPLAPMKFGGHYAVILTDELRDESGKELPRSAVFDALKQGALTDNEAVENMRERYESLFEVAEASGWERESLLLMWDFRVASEDFVLGPAKSIRDQIATTDPSTVSFDITEKEEAPNQHASWLIKGTFQPPNFLSENNELNFDENYGVVERGERPSYDFTMVVPAVAKERGNLDLVLIGHGLFGKGRDMLTGGAEDLMHSWANELGAVMIATDWVGLSGGDRELIISEVLVNVDRVRVITDRLVQSHANNLMLVELALADLTSPEVLPVEHGEPILNGENVYYYGISLGGIQGAGQTALSPRISRSVLAVPGAGWVNLIQRSTQFEPLEVYFDNFYPDPLSQLVLLSTAQTFFDWSDPGNLTYLIRNAPQGAMEKTIVLQEAIGDCQVANITTDLLARSIGASHLEYATDPIYGLGTVEGPYKGVAITQVRVEDSLDAYFPPDANILPELDNGVHNSAVLRDSMFEQVSHLFLEGELIHTCSGECDPD